jgi:glycerol uptake facilitator-like aquaporin
MVSRSKIAMVVAEILGTGVLTAVVLAVGRSPIGLPYFVALAAGLTLMLMVLTVGPSSGAHLNPAVTLGLWTVRKINTLQALLYVAAQFLGAVLAWRLYTYLINGPVKNIAGKDFSWQVLVAELVGTLVFTFGVAAAVYQRYEGGRLAATIGGSFLLGILVASAASNGMLNPAVALGAQSWSKAYVFGPLVGSVLGMNLYLALFASQVSAAVPTRQVNTRSTLSRKTTARRRTTAKKASRK